MQMFTYYYLTKISEQEVIDGWEVADDGDFVIKLKKWRADETNNDALVNKRKKTFEVIGDNRCNSYNIEKVPAYALAMEALKSGTASILEFQHKLLMEKNVVSEEFDLYGTAHIQPTIIEQYQKQHDSLSTSDVKEDRIDNELAVPQVRAKPKPSVGAATSAAYQRVATVDNHDGQLEQFYPGEHQYHNGGQRAELDPDVDGSNEIDSLELPERPVSRHTALKEKILKQKDGGGVKMIKQHKKGDGGAGGHHHNHTVAATSPQGGGGSAVKRSEDEDSINAVAMGADLDYEEEVDMTPGVYDENDWRQGASGLV
jgi:hypothetical protein